MPLPRQRMADAVVQIRQGLGPAVVAVGVGGGLIGAAYVGTLHVLERFMGPAAHSPVVQLGILVAVGCAVALITRFGGESGDVELLVDNIHVLGGAEDVRRLRPLIPASLLCVAAGGAMGPEAPLVQTSGTYGTWLATRLGRPTPDVRVLTITGMAAAFTVLFGAPLGAALFALEILHRRGLQYYEALVPAVVGSLCGYAVYLGLSGVDIEPVWTFPTVGTLHAADLLTAALVGVAGAACAAVFAFSARGARRLFGLVPRSLRFVAGGLALGLLGIWSPYALTFGEAQLAEMLDLRLAAGALAVAVIAKLVGTTVTLASGWKGGFIIPLFFMGATLGQLVHRAVPSTNQSVLMACFMVAICVGVTKTPLGTTLVVTEMAGLPLLPITLLAAIVSLLLTRPLTVIETQRPRSDPEPAHAAMSRTDLSTADYRALAEFRHALRVFQRFSEDAARQAGVTPAQHQLMLAVKGWNSDEAPTIADMADRLQLKHHSTVELVQRAVISGLVRSVTDEHDGRRQLLHLTATGEATLTSLSLLHRDELRRFRTEMHDVLRELD